MPKNLHKIFWVLIAALLVTVPCAADATGETTVEDEVAPIDAAAGGKAIVHLYFGDPEPPYLRSEQRVVDSAGDPATFGKHILDALMKGPKSNFAPVVPEGTVARTFFLDNNGTGYADLSISVRDNHPGGSDAEVQTVYAIVNALVLNVPGVQRVQLLIKGEASETLAGNMCLDRTYTPNMLLIR
jgi:spore germination protein GerM